MSIRHTLTVGDDRFRIGPWHADRGIAYLAMSPEMPRPSLEGLRRCLGSMAEAGYTSVITSALHPAEARSFLQSGFAEYDRLRVLAHALDDLDPDRPPLSPSVRLRRARRRDRPAALTVDGRAFPWFWRLDAPAMSEAEQATPVSRFRVATVDDAVVGYAITGKGAGQGFLQRLATDPDRSGQGVGSALVVDALRWSARRRARRLLVNTQLGNHRALDLYRRLGFQPTPTDLVVLRRVLP